MSIPKRNKTHWKLLFAALLLVFVILLAKVGFDAKLFSGNLGGPTVAQSPNVANIKYNPCKQTRVLNTLVFMDDNSYLVKDPEILDTFNYASNLLMERTCTKFNVLKIWHVNPTKGEDIDKITYATLKANKKLLDQSQYFVFFTDQNTNSHYNGGVAWPIAPSYFEIGDNNYCNTYSGPNNETNFLYGSLVDWDGRFGACGYDDQGSGNNHISDVSFGGQCQNQPGLKCVWSPTANYYVCPQFVNDPKVLEPRLFRSTTIIHELMHSFGIYGNMDHLVGSQACIDKYNSMNYKLNFQCPKTGSPWELADCWFSICQYAWVNFIQAQNLCNLPKVFKPNANQIPAVSNSSLNLKADEKPFN